MLSKIKEGFSILPYCIQFRLNIMTSILFFVLGILFFFFNEFKILGMLYILLGPMMVMQLLKSLEVSSLVATSPKRKFFLSTFPDRFCIVSQCFSYILCIVLLGMWYKREMHSLDELTGQIILGAVVISLLTIYMSIAYKKFLLSLVSFFIVYFGLYTNVDQIINKLHSFISLSKESSILIGFAIILLGNLIGQFLQYITRKHPLDRLTVGLCLRKYM